MNREAQTALNTAAREQRIPAIQKKRGHYL